MKKVVIVSNLNKDKDFSVTNKVLSKLLSIGFEVFSHSDSGYENSYVEKYSAFPDGIDLVIVVGGDGSVIDASTLAISNDIPILGINLGRMGYLTEVETDSLAVLDKLSTGEYSVIEKMLLTVMLKDEAVVSGRYAVNDVTLSRDGILRISDICCRMNLTVMQSFRIRTESVNMKRVIFK